MFIEKISPSAYIIVSEWEMPCTAPYVFTLFCLRGIFCLLAMQHTVQWFSQPSNKDEVVVCNEEK